MNHRYSESGTLVISPSSVRLTLNKFQAFCLHEQYDERRDEEQ